MTTSGLSKDCYEFGFILEQSLGHVTHTKNLMTNVARDPEVRAHWGLIDFEPSGVAAQIPLYRSNWTVRAGVRAYRQIARMNSHTKLDALFFHTQVPAILAQRWLRAIPGIVSLDATPLQYDELGAFYRHEKGPAWLETLKCDCFISARRLVAWSEWTKLGLLEEYGVAADKVTVIPPGVNVDEWRRPAPRVPHAGSVKILFVGGDLQRKGGGILLEAFRELRLPGLELHLVTKSQLPPEPGVFVYNNLEANSQPLKDLYHTCDIFALPTFGDCLPMVLSEAGASGMAIISTNVAAIPEIILNGETGLIVPAGDAIALTQAIRDLSENSDLRMRLGERANAHVGHHYDAETNATRLLSLLKAEVDASRTK